MEAFNLTPTPWNAFLSPPELSLNPRWRLLDQNVLTRQNMPALQAIISVSFVMCAEVFNISLKSMIRYPIPGRQGVFTKGKMLTKIMAGLKHRSRVIVPPTPEQP